MIDSIQDLQERLADVPSTLLLRPQEILRDYPHLQDDRRAVKLIAVEAYIRELERGNRITPAEFANSYPEASDGLASQLAGLAELHSRLGIWSAGPPCEENEYPQTGDVIRGYTLLQEIGRGAFSRVYLAADSNVGHRRVALKFTPHDSNEPASLGTLAHPHLPRILTCDNDPSRNLRMICLEYIGTRSLVDLVRELHGSARGRPKGEKVKATRAVEVVMQVADALAHAHEHGTLHLDVKPANILLRNDGSAVLIDFNLSAPASSAATLGFRGTLTYAAPEVIESAVTGTLAATPVSTASDIYSLGAVLFELLTGRLPWPTDDIRDHEHAVAARKESPVRPSAISTGIDTELDAIVATALAVAPEDRYASARQFCDALDRYGRRRWRRPAASLAVLAVCVVMILGFVLFQPSPANHSAEQLTAISRTASPIFASQPATRAFPDLPEAAPAMAEGVDAADEDPVRVRWAHLPEDELREIYQLMGSTPPPAGEGVRAAARGYVLMLLRDYRPASSRLRDASQKGMSKDVGVNANLGYCYIQQRQFGAASRYLDLALKEAPENEVVLFLRSVVELQVSQHLRRSSDLTHLDRLIRIETPLAERFAAEVAAFCEYSRSVATEAPQTTMQSNADQQSSSREVDDRTMVHATFVDLDAVEIIHIGSSPVPLSHLHEALSAGVDLTTSFHQTVDDYLHMIHEVHVSSRPSADKVL